MIAISIVLLFQFFHKMVARLFCVSDFRKQRLYFQSLYVVVKAQIMRGEG